ncbi:MAG: hypothetical protein JW795_04125, partial [Chitinivibrionales bacterium]|nr:hypothetical protein [Chitinivibrionales bacterium]
TINYKGVLTLSIIYFFYHLPCIAKAKKIRFPLYRNQNKRNALRLVIRKKRRMPPCFSLHQN